MRPQKGDYPDYAQKYLDLIEGDDIISILHRTSREMTEVVNSFPQHKGDYTMLRVNGQLSKLSVIFQILIEFLHIVH